MSQLKQEGFSRRVEKRLLESRNEKLQDLEDEDLVELFALFWDELAVCLNEGYRVIFDGWISFFTNPVKRKCYDTSTSGLFKAGKKRPPVWSFKQRVRFKPLSKFRKRAEWEISELEYTQLTSAKNDKKN